MAMSIVKTFQNENLLKWKVHFGEFKICRLKCYIDKVKKVDFRVFANSMPATK